MIVEELVGALGFRVRGLSDAQKFIKTLEQARKAAKDAGRGLDTGLTGRNAGLNRVASDAERAAKALRNMRIEAEKASRVRFKPGAFGPGGPGGAYSPTRHPGPGRGGHLLDAAAAGSGVGLGRAGVAAAAAYGGGRVASRALGSSMDFERAMIEVTKATDATQAERAQYEKDLLRLARDTGQNKEGLAGMMAQAGFSGRPKNELLQFTRYGAMASTAWQTTPEATGQSLAEIGNIYEADQKRIEEIGDQINFAADSSASRETDLLEIVRRVGSTAKTAGMTTGDLLAFGASLKERGVQTEIAASGMEAFINFLKLGEEYSKGADDGLAKLGHNSDKLRKAFVKAPMETAIKFLEKIQSIKDPMKKAEVLTGIFGATRQDDVERMSNAVGKMAEYRDKFNDQKQYGGTVLTQFAEQLQNDVSKIDQSTQQLDVLLKRIGDPMKQALGYGAEKLNKALDYIDDKKGNATAKASNFSDDLPGLGHLDDKPAARAVAAATFAERFGAAPPMDARRSFLPSAGAGIPNAWRTKKGLSLGYGNLGSTGDNTPSFSAGTFGIGGAKGLDWANKSASQTVQNITNNTNTGNDQRQQSVTVNQTVNGVPGVAQAAAQGTMNALSSLGPSITKTNLTPTGSMTAP